MSTSRKEHAMAIEKLAISLEDVQGLFTDKDGLRKLVEESVQKIIEAEFEKHMGRMRYECGKGLSTPRNFYNLRTLHTRFGQIFLCLLTSLLQDIREVYLYQTSPGNDTLEEWNWGEEEKSEHILPPNKRLQTGFTGISGLDS